MKFLCVSCDEGMRLEGARGPHEGSLEATFGCPRCGHKILMLTNPWETQLVSTLGVKIGGSATPASPYERVLSGLALPSEQRPLERESAPGSGTACPFAGVVGQMEAGGAGDGIRWSEEAMVRIDRIPSFIRSVVQRAIERYASEQGHRVITDAVMDEARSRLGM